MSFGNQSIIYLIIHDYYQTDEFTIGLLHSNCDDGASDGIGGQL